jgi:CheY-like chemotaxis protein
VSNALKYTERGEVRVSARLSADRTAIRFAVADTGIGIAPADHERIFQEFTQIDSPLQRRVRGTGLGLPLCKRLAELLGGHVELESAEGAGSTFVAEIPICYQAPAGACETWELDPRRTPILVVEDDPETMMRYRRHLIESEFQVIGASSLREARQALGLVRPRAVLLDILLRGEDGWTFLAELKRRPEAANLPVVVVSTLEDDRKAYALGADAYLTKPADPARLVEILVRLTKPDTIRRVLLVDDEEISRYVVRQSMAPYAIAEAASGTEALRLAAAERPDLVCLDLRMPDLDGFAVLERLRLDPATRQVPVVMITSKALDESERSRLADLGGVLLLKEAISRDRVASAIEDALRLVETAK